MLVFTESGSIYELEETRVRRLVSANPLRRDGEWIRLLSRIEPVRGHSMVLILEPLNELATFTRRETTKVVDIQEVH